MGFAHLNQTALIDPAHKYKHRAPSFAYFATAGNRDLSLSAPQAVRPDGKSPTAGGHRCLQIISIQRRTMEAVANPRPFMTTVQTPARTILLPFSWSPVPFFCSIFSVSSPKFGLPPTPLACGNLFSTILFLVTCKKSITCIFDLLTNQ